MVSSPLYDDSSENAQDSPAPLYDDSSENAQDSADSSAINVVEDVEDVVR